MTRFEDEAGELVEPMEALNAKVTQWYKARHGLEEGEDDEANEEVREEGTASWRQAWKESVYDVNRIPGRLWPTHKEGIERRVNEHHR